MHILKMLFQEDCNECLNASHLSASEMSRLGSPKGSIFIFNHKYFVFIIKDIELFAGILSAHISLYFERERI